MCRCTLGVSLKNILKNSKGMSMIQLILGAAIASGAGLVLMKQTTNSQKTMVAEKNKLYIEGFVDNLASSFQSKEFCDVNFKGKNTTIASMDTIISHMDVNKDEVIDDSDIVLTRNQENLTKTFKVTEMKLSPQGDNMIVLDLVIENLKAPTTNNIIKKKIKLSAVSEAGVIQECHYNSSFENLGDINPSNICTGSGVTIKDDACFFENIEDKKYNDYLALTAGRIVT